jgi:cell division cycle protein 20 (cofactor of APC complex)
MTLPLLMLPKTPTRYRSRSEAKTPLTPSLTAALNAVSIFTPSNRSRTKSKPTQISHSRSRPSSPVKSVASNSFVVSDALQRQAGGGVIRKGGFESRLDVVTLDYVPPPKPDLKRSRSTPAAVSIHRLILSYLSHSPISPRTAITATVS